MTGVPPPAVRAELSMSGGLGPFALRPRVIAVDGSELPPAGAAELAAAAARALDAPPADPATSGRPDVFSYRLTIDPGRVLEFDDLTMPADVRPLVDLLNRIAAARGTG